MQFDRVVIRIFDGFGVILLLVLMGALAYPPTQVWITQSIGALQWLGISLVILGIYRVIVFFIHRVM